MKEKTKKFGAWLLAATLAFAGVSGVADEVQQPTQAVVWFSAGFDGTDEHWEFPEGAAKFESGKIVIDTAVDEQVVYTPAATKQSAKVAVKTTFEMTPLDALSAVPNVQAAFTVVEENEALCYYGLAKVGNEAAWVALTGVPPVDGTNVSLTIEFDYSAKTVTYKIDDVALSNNGGKTALPLADETKTAVSSVAYTGSGTASLLVGDYCDADRKFAVENAQALGGYDYYATEPEAQNAAGAGGVYWVFNGTGWEAKTAPEEIEIPVDEPGGAAIPVKIPAEIFEQKGEQKIVDKDGKAIAVPTTPEQKQQFLVTEQPNGLKVWQNVAMGVNGNTARNALAMTSREPTAEEVKKAKDEGKTVDIVINTPISDFTPPETTGVTVRYKLLRSTDGGENWTAVKDENGNDLELEKPEFPAWTQDDALISEGDTFWKFQAVFTSQANEGTGN